MGCSRQCRSLMHNLATGLMISTYDDLEAISSCAWPSLGVVVINNQSTDSVARGAAAVAECKLHVLAVLTWYEIFVDGYVVLILKPTTDQQYPNLGIKRQLVSLCKMLHSVKRYKIMASGC